MKVIKPMNTGELSVLHLAMIVLVTLGLLVLVWEILRSLTKRWAAEVDRQEAAMERDLQNLSVRREALEAEAGQYSPDMPPPYSAAAQDLQTTLGALSIAYQKTEDEVAAFAEKGPLPGAGSPRTVLWPAPRFWRQRLRSLKEITAQLATLRHHVMQAEALLKMLRGKPLETARRARNLRRICDRAGTVLKSLRDDGLHGPPLEEAADRLQQCRIALDRLPNYLLQESDSHVMRRARPPEISQAWRELEDLEAESVPLEEQLRGWQDAAAIVGGEVDEMRRTITSATDQLAQVHASIDVTALAETWKATRAQAEAIATRYAAPSVEDLGQHDEIARLTDEAEGLIGKLAAVEALRRSLEASIADSVEQLDQIEMQLRQIAEGGRYPLDRVPFQAELDRIRNRASKLVRDATAARGTHAVEASARRTPAELETDLALAKSVVQQGRSLMAQLAEAREDRRRLRALLEQAEADAEGAGSHIDWLTWAEDLHRRTRTYALENWSRDESTPGPDREVTKILEDARALDAQLRLWMPDRVDEPLAPETLHQRVIEVERLLQEVEIFQNRLDRITRRLQEIQRMEETAKAVTAPLCEALERLDAVASATLPPSLAGEENHWTALRDLLKEGVALRQALDTPGTGDVEEELADVETWTRDVQRTLRDWHRVLQGELNDAEALLRSQLDELRAIAPLHEAPAVQAAREAIDGLQSSAWSGRGALSLDGISEGLRRVIPDDRRTDRSVVQGLVRLAEEVGDLLNALAKLDEAEADLVSMVLEPLSDPVERWREAEAEATRAFAGLQHLEAVSSRLSPPVSCDTAPVASHLAAVEQRREQLLQNGATVEDVVAELDEIAQRYREAVEMVTHREEAYEARRAELDATLDRLEAWCADLEAYGKLHRNDPAIRSAVRARLDEIESAWTQLRVQYERESGLIPGDEAQRALDRLWRQAHRDLPIGAGADIIPAIAIERRR
ncbi:MAG: hypothetical protein ACP5JG_03560 [Anaerolineae bacterium]